MLAVRLGDIVETINVHQSRYEFSYHSVVTTKLTNRKLAGQCNEDKGNKIPRRPEVASTDAQRDPIWVGPEDCYRNDWTSFSIQQF